jgi:argininosuccinate lyase
MNGIIDTMKIKSEKMLKQVNGSFTMAVELAETLSNEAGLSFRESYKVAADLVNLSISRGKTLDKLSPEDVESSVSKLFKKKLNIPKDLVEKATDPKKSLYRRISYGSPHPDHVKNAVLKNSKIISENQFELDDKRQALIKSLEHLHEVARNRSKS